MGHDSASWAVPLVVSFLAAGGVQGQWPQFRGPNGSGVDAASGYPMEFSPSKNVIWKKAVLYGQSSPVLADGRLYLTASDGNQLMVFCLNAKSGQELWRRELHRERPHKTFKANDPASPTPAADERGVVAFFADYGLAAYSPDGKEQWKLPLGPFKNFYGMAASPILAGGMVVLVCDQQRDSFLLAVDRTSGNIRWKVERTGAPIGWATPMVFRPSGNPPQLIVLGSTRLDSYSLSSGERMWWMPVGSGGSLGTPVASDETLMVSTLSSNEPWMPTFDSALAKYDKDGDGRISQREFAVDPDLGEHFGWIDTDSNGQIDAREWNEARTMGIGEFGAFALRPGSAQGKIEPSAVLWRFKKNLPYIPAPVLYQGVYYMVRTGGIITSLDAATGRLLKEGRSSEAPGDYYASPVAADGKIFLAGEEGKITVLKAGGEWDVLRVNDVGEEIHATPALSGGRIYVRTRSSLYCFGNLADPAK